MTVPVSLEQPYLFLLLVATPPERIEEECKWDKPAYKFREGVVGSVVRVARLLDGPESSNSTEYPERNELRLRDVIKALHGLIWLQQ